MPSPFTYPVAKAVPFDNEDNLFDKENVQEAIEEINFRELVNEPTGFKDKSESTISFNKTNLTFTITPVSSYFTIYCHGHVFYKIQESVQIGDVEGVWYIYYDSSGVLVASQTEWNLGGGIAPVSIIYWDYDNKKHIYFAEERHGLVMDWSTHLRMHRVERAKIEDIYNNFVIGNYIENGNGSLDAHAQMSISGGNLWDEDLKHIITHANTPSNPFEQYLNLPMKIPIFYRIGDENNPKWRIVDATNFPVVYDGINPIKYNKLTSGVWSLENCTNGKYTLTWILVTNNIYNPIIGIIGTHNTSDLSVLLKVTPAVLLKATFVKETDIPYKLIFKTDTGYSNTTKAILTSMKNLVITTETQDRYNFTAQYIGSAGSGKYLELYIGSSSDESPFYFPENSFVRTITLQCTSLCTGTLSFYRITNLVNPVFSISLSNENKKTWNLAEPFFAGDELCIKVSSGSFNKPTLRIWIQSTIS